MPLGGGRLSADHPKEVSTPAWRVDKVGGSGFHNSDDSLVLEHLPAGRLHGKVGGRTQRFLTEAQRVALATRHSQCADGCDRPFAWTELHRSTDPGRAPGGGRSVAFHRRT